MVLMNDNAWPSSDCPAHERRVLLANPRGFCAGVTRAIDAVERALTTFGPPVYVRRPIVHNRAVMDRLAAMGAIFVQELDEVPEGAAVILSAHGVSPSVGREANERNLHAIDATCPLVAKVHADVVAHHRAGRHVLLIGHAGHPEIIGTIGHVPPGGITLIAGADDVANTGLPVGQKVAYAVQTTFSVRDASAIIARIEGYFADVVGPRAGNICYATTNRQAAVEAIAARADYMLIVGDPSSSNANRLVEMALAAGCPQARLVEGGGDLDRAAVAQARCIGLSAAASTPDMSVQDVCRALAEQGFSIFETEGLRETAMFRPVALGSP